MKRALTWGEDGDGELKEDAPGELVFGEGDLGDGDSELEEDTPGELTLGDGERVSEEAIGVRCGDAA